VLILAAAVPPPCFIVVILLRRVLPAHNLPFVVALALLWFGGVVAAPRNVIFSKEKPTPLWHPVFVLPWREIALPSVTFCLQSIVGQVGGSMWRVSFAGLWAVVYQPRAHVPMR
jgi:hypothetical protein